MRLTRWVGALALLLGVAAVGAPQVHTGHLLAPVGPLGHWKGDDAQPPKSAEDATGNGYVGAYSAQGATVAPPGAPTKFPNSGCFTLDGTAGVVTIPDTQALRITGDFTVSFWKKKTANVKDWSRVVGKGNGAQRNFGVWEAPEGDNRILFQMYSPAGGSVLDLWSSVQMPINAWSHVLCTVSSNAASVWINGAHAGNATRTGEPGTAADPLTFGFAGYHAFWAGQIDDVRVYNRALSTQEIQYLAQGNGPPAAPTALAAAGTDGKQATFKWTASATPPPAGTATFYILKRSKTQGSGYVPVATALHGTAFTDTRPDTATTYYYVVTAVNVGGESPASNEVAVAPTSN